MAEETGVNDSLSGFRVTYPNGPLSALMNDVWTAMVRDGGSISREACLGSGLLWGMALALAGPEYTTAVLLGSTDDLDLAAGISKLRRWIETHPIGWEQVAQS